MSFNFSNRVRLGVEEFEGRVLADGKMPVLPAAQGNLAVVRTAVAPVPLVFTGLTAASAPTKAAALATAANASYTYTAFTIINNSSATVAYSIKWGNGSWTSYTLTPHQGLTHYLGGLNQKATISYDKSFAAGYQDQEYTLAGTNVTFPPGLYLTTPTPSYGAGHHYTFGNVPGGVQLYS